MAYWLLDEVMRGYQQIAKWLGGQLVGWRKAQSHFKKKEIVVRGNGDSLMFGLPIRQTIDLMNDCVAHERSVDRPPAPVCQVYHKVGNATAPFTINGASKYVIQLLQYKAGYAKQKYLGCSRISSLLILTCQETFPVHTS